MQNAKLLNKKTKQSIHCLRSIAMALFIALFALSAHGAEQQGPPQGEADHPEEVISPPPEKDFKPAFDKARQAYEAGQFEKGLELLQPFEISHAGQVEYDYLLGQCALEANQLNSAISAFQRVLTIDPGLAAARIELARVYYSKGVQEQSRGAFEQARSEFNNVLKLSPPKAIEASIREYLDTIARYLKVRPLKIHPYLELTTGFDTNANNGPGEQNFSFYDPSFGVTRYIELDRDDQRTGSSFARASAGVQLTLPLFTRHFDLFFSGRAGTSGYEKAHYLDHDDFAAQIGANHYGDNNKKTISINFNKTYLDGQRYADEFYAQLEWAQRLGKADLLSLRFLGGDVNYNQEFYPRSTDGSRLGIEWSHLSPQPDRKMRQLLLLSGRDDDQDCHDNCLNVYRRDVTGFRLATSNNVSARSRVYRSIYFEYSDYDQPFFQERRIDRRIELFFGFSTRFSKRWQVRPELQIIYNNSSISLYESIRTVAAVTVKWSF